jgi:hypothetical protein
LCKPAAEAAQRRSGAARGIWRRRSASKNEIQSDPRRLRTISSARTSFVNEAISNKVSLLCADRWKGYMNLGETFPHEMVDRHNGQYVIGAISHDTIEGFWSLIKRCMVGTFHKVSKKYLPLYVAEFQSLT